MIRRILLLLCVNTVLWFVEPASAAMTVDSIQAQLLAHPWSVLDRETIHEREARSELMAKSLYDAAEELEPKMSKKWLVAAAIVTWWYETRFSLEVHSGGLSRWGSDDGKAKCFGQLHEWSVGIEHEKGESLEDFRQRQKEKWLSLAGTDYESTKQCALATMRQLQSKYRNCASLDDFDRRWVGTFGDYGSGGRSCTSGPTSEKRLERLKKVVVRL